MKKLYCFILIGVITIMSIVAPLGRTYAMAIPVIKVAEIVFLYVTASVATGTAIEYLDDETLEDNVIEFNKYGKNRNGDDNWKKIIGLLIAARLSDSSKFALKINGEDEEAIAHKTFLDTVREFNNQYDDKYIFNKIDGTILGVLTPQQLALIYGEMYKYEFINEWKSKKYYRVRITNNSNDNFTFSLDVSENAYINGDQLVLKQPFAQFSADVYGDSLNINYRFGIWENGICTYGDTNGITGTRNATNEELGYSVITIQDGINQGKVYGLSQAYADLISVNPIYLDQMKWADIQRSHDAIKTLQDEGKNVVEIGLQDDAPFNIEWTGELDDPSVFQGSANAIGDLNVSDVLDRQSLIDSGLGGDGDDPTPPKTNLPYVEDGIIPWHYIIKMYTEGKDFIKALMIVYTSLPEYVLICVNGMFVAIIFGGLAIKLGGV